MARATITSCPSSSKHRAIHSLSVDDSITSSRKGFATGFSASATDASLYGWIKLRYLTEVDGVDHFAMGAIRKHLVSKPEGVGSARFVRLNDEPDTAELAVTVVDGYHGKGLGGMLLQRLIEAAWERDVRWFRAELLADNVESRRMIESLSPDVQFRHAGDDAISATLPVPEPDQTPTAPGFFDGTPIPPAGVGKDESALPAIHRPAGTKQDTGSIDRSLQARLCAVWSPLRHFI